MFVKQVLPLNCPLPANRSVFAQRKTGDLEYLGVGNEDLLDFIGDFENVGDRAEISNWNFFLLSNFVCL